MTGDDIENLAKYYGISPDLLLGQHFIKNSLFLDVIVEKIPSNSTVIEIGPGLGQLTEELAKHVKTVIGIEIDKRFVKPLSLLETKYQNLRIVYGDALSQILDREVSKVTGSLYLVSNLPYHITEPFIRKMANFRNIPSILMVGKKFGYQAQIDDPENSNFTELSFLCSSFFDVNKLADVPKDAFYPIPKTDSTILEFIPKKITLPNDTPTFIAQDLILKQDKGGLIKNNLMNIFIRIRFNNQNLTKNEARALVSKLKLSDSILNKSFSQLNNEEVKRLAQALLDIKNTL